MFQLVLNGFFPDGGAGGVFLGILGGGVRPGSPNFHIMGLLCGMT